MIELAKARQQADLTRLPDEGYTYDADAAHKVRQFFESYLTHYKAEWAGQRLNLEPWQYEDILAPVFGWYRPDGTRRYREAYIEIPRKNGKTLIAAGVGLYLMLADDEPAAEIYAAATKKDQAKLCWSDAAQMVKMSQVLGSKVKVYRSNMHVLGTASKFEPLGADSSTLDGLNPHGTIIDELHAHKNRLVYDVLKTAYGSRRQPLTWIITTAGLFDPESIGWQKHEHAVRVLRGEVEDDSFFAYIACADPEDDPFDEETWRKANPNYGVSVKEDYLAQQAEDAQKQPSFYNSFLRYHLNIWTQSESRWIDADKWAACGGPIDVAELEGRQCWGGFDMSNTNDLTALALVFPPEDDPDGDWILLVYHWCPADSAQERSQRDGVMYTNWIREGYIEATPGNVVDYSRVKAAIAQITEPYAMQELWYDPWNSSQLTLELADDYGLNTLPCRQGFVSLNEPSKEFERLVYSGRLRHGDNPVLRWQASHITVKTDPAGNIKPDKGASREKIDGLVAAVMAIGAAKKAQQSIAGIYDDEGPMVIDFG